MMDLIPRDTAIAAAKSLFGMYNKGLYGAAVRRQYGLIIETAEATIRAIPTIDPAAIREAALKEAIIRLNADGRWNAIPTIEALIGEKK